VEAAKNSQKGIIVMKKFIVSGLIGVVGFACGFIAKEFLVSVVAHEAEKNVPWAVNHMDNYAKMGREIENKLSS
jgi:hypothetical protein